MDINAAIAFVYWNINYAIGFSYGILVSYWDWLLGLSTF